MILINLTEISNQKTFYLIIPGILLSVISVWLILDHAL